MRAYELTLDMGDTTRVVRYRPGVLRPGRWGARPEDYEPDDGEPPEVLSVTELDDQGNEVEVLSGLSCAEVARLEAECWEHQMVYETGGDW